MSWNQTKDHMRAVFENKVYETYPSYIVSIHHMLKIKETRVDK